MKKEIDCLIIGHNNQNISEYVSIISKMGENSGAFQDLNLSFLNYKNKHYTISGIFNLINDNDKVKPLSWGENFSNTIAYLYSYLKNNGNFKIDYISSFQDEKERLKDLLKSDVKLIIITTTFYVSYFPLMEVVNFVKKFNSKVKIVIGGPFINNKYKLLPKESFNHLLSILKGDYYVVNSDGEKALLELIKSIKENKPVPEKNIIVRNKNEYIHYPVIEENNPLGENIIDWCNYKKRNPEFINIRTSKSCMFKCNFCSFPQKSGKYQQLNISQIEKELNSLSVLSSLKSIHFIDDTFNVPSKRFKDFLRMLIKNKYSFKWNCTLRCSTLDYETVELMKESNCEGCFLGIESGDDELLIKMNKKAKAIDYINGIEWLNKNGIITYGSFIIGFPGETNKTIDKTIDFINNSKLDFFRTQMWYCDTLTPVWNDKDKYGINGSSFEWSHNTMNSNEAAHAVNKIFKEVKSTCWLPQQEFDFNGIFFLLNKGFNIDQIKNFIMQFNHLVSMKIDNGYAINDTDLKNMYDLLSGKENIDKNQYQLSNANIEFNI